MPTPNLEAAKDWIQSTRDLRAFLDFASFTISHGGRVIHPGLSPTDNTSLLAEGLGELSRDCMRLAARLRGLVNDLDAGTIQLAPKDA
jgi:hypothetical protein